MELRRRSLLAAALPAFALAGVSAAAPALRPLGDVALGATAVLAAAVLWTAAGRRDADRLSWRLLAVAPVLAATGPVLAAALHPADGMQLVTLRWLPSLPGYAAAMVALLALVQPQRLRRGGLRLAVELALFVTSCSVVVQLLMLGADGRWSAVPALTGSVLGAGVLATSATMAAALTLLGVVERRRRTTALLLLAGGVLLALGRGLATHALLGGALVWLDVSRLPLLLGLLFPPLAVLGDPGPEARRERRDVPGALGQLLPYAALALMTAAVATTSVLGHRPSPQTLGGVLGGILLAVAHRGVTLRDERRMATRLLRSEAYFRSLVGSASDVVLILDDELRITWTSAALQRALGAGSAVEEGCCLPDLVHPDDAPRVRALVAGAGPTPAGLVLFRLPDAAGCWRYLEAAVSDLRADADVGGVVLHCRDMTERHDREQTLLGVAYTDPKTGLPNRAGFQQRLELAVSGATAGNDEPASMLLLQLAGLVEVRDRAGREAAGAVITELGRRLRATVRADDVVARLGGGAFAVLAAGCDADTDLLAARCLAVVERPVALAGGLEDLTANVGAVSLQPGLTVEEVLERAELAVRAALGSGLGTTARYTPALGAAAARERQLRDQLGGAVERGEMSLLFEPIVSLSEQRVVGVEALLRWRHPLLGDVLPAEFLPLAQQVGLLGSLQAHVLQEATSAVAALPATEAPLRLGVNLPLDYLAGGTVVADVERALRASGLGAERLVLELPEAALHAEEEQVALDVTTLRLMGVHVALDGFGAGDSALHSLTRAPIDVLKLDRSFTARIDRDRRARALCQAVVGLAVALRLDVVATGVETTAQLAALAGLDCGFAQGFLVGRAMPVAELAGVLAAGGLLWPGLVAATER